MRLRACWRRPDDAPAWEADDLAWVLDIAPNKTEFLSRTRAGNLVPVSCELPADLETPISVFLKLRGEGNAFLLESVEGGERIGRYSFIGSGPLVAVNGRGNTG